LSFRPGALSTVFAARNRTSNPASSYFDYGRYFPNEITFLRILCFIDAVNIIPVPKVSS
jgi:hypothetical protein